MDEENESEMTSVTDISIYHEFDQMIAELHSIQQIHEQSIQLSQQISSITSLTNNNDDNKIIITYDKKKMDLDELIESIYEESENELKDGKMRFGELLLEKLEKCSFHN
jgi:copper chaperone CopZ